jgi:hypothetical protein
MRAYFDVNRVPTDPSTAMVNLSLELLLLEVGFLRGRRVCYQWIA